MRTAPRRSCGQLGPLVLGVALVATTGCGGAHDVPASPTWVDVEPIFRGECTGCHGTTAATTGGGFRFDFYDMTKDTCGDAAAVLGDATLAKALSQPGPGGVSRILSAITTTPDMPNTRPIMPPPPAPYLADWEWKTIIAWIQSGFPRGSAPADNHAPTIQLFGDLSTADRSLDVTAVVSDADGDPVVGVLSLGDQSLKMDRSGAFSAHVDTTAWTAGQRPITAVLCDGWAATGPLQLGTITVQRP